MKKATRVENILKWVICIIEALHQGLFRTYYFVLYVNGLNIELKIALDVDLCFCSFQFKLPCFESEPVKRNL